jgi:protein phosphatase
MKTGDTETCCGVASVRAELCSAGRTHTGKQRQHNEDAILVRDDLGLWVVADGLGGHASGEYASTMIIERLGALAPDRHGLDLAEAVEDALSEINLDLRATARSRGVDLIASTVVFAIDSASFLLCGWVGDSRAYSFEDGRLQQITRDHAYGANGSSPAPLGGGVPSYAAPGVLTRAVGAEDQLFVDWVVAPNRPGARLFLCSDGINKEISDDELEREFRREPGAPELLDQLFELALSRAARDNLSGVIVQASA